MTTVNTTTARSPDSTLLRGRSSAATASVTPGKWVASTGRPGYIIELADGGPWLKNNLTWTPNWEERGVWHEITDAELAVARSLSPKETYEN